MPPSPNVKAGGVDEGGGVEPHVAEGSSGRYGDGRVRRWRGSGFTFSRRQRSRVSPNTLTVNGNPLCI